MKISYNWLQRHIEEKLPSPESLKETIIFHAFEVESEEKIGDDTVFDIKTLPDRNHDCYCHAGMAREIAGLLGFTFTAYPLPELPLQTDLPLATKVEIQSDICRRYIAIEVKDVTIADSPAWLKDAIEAVGIRSINNVVDATNLILLDDGQPVHAFDADKIDGGIVVRMAHDGEQVITLSKEEKKLSPNDLVIADYLGPLAIAGVKGGQSAEITTETKRIIIEIANFEPTAIRKTSRRLNLITDASKRFENEITPEIAYDAARHVVGIIQKVAGGEVVGVFDFYPHSVQPRTLSFSLTDVTRLLGGTILEQDIDRWIAQYHIEAIKEGGVYTITIPKSRLDISGPHDIAEEIGRMVGYDRIPSSPLPFTPVEQKDSEYRAVTAVKYWLAQNGFREVLNYTFTKKGDVYVAYGTKDKSALRSNLSDGLKESYEKNRLNAPLLGISAIRLFEIGTVFIGKEDAQHEEVRVATVDKGIFEELPLQEFIKKYSIDITRSIVPVSIPHKTFKPWSPYPFITRDIAVWVNPADQTSLETIVTAFAQQYCVREPVLFDHFEKEGRTSVAYRLVFQSFEKTLTEAEVEVWFSELVQKINSEQGFEIR